MNSAIKLCLKTHVETPPHRPQTPRMRAVCAMFGLAPDHPRPIANPPHLALHPGDLLLLTGPSGSGKSTLLRAITRALTAHSSINLMSLTDAPLREPPDGRPALVDCFPAPLDETLRILTCSGLAEARLLLRSPAELSAGEHFRFRLAQFFASDADVLLADEFAALLDRVTARAAAWQLGKFIRQSVHSNRPRAAIVATSHIDLAADLHPTLTIHTKFESEAEII